MQAGHFFDFPNSLPFGRIFKASLPPWEWLPLIEKALAVFDFPPFKAKVPAGFHLEGDVWIHPTVELPPFGSIRGPVYIGPDCELRPGVFIRGNVIAGAGCVLGNSCEFKNSLLLDKVQVPHFSYVGDSVLGNGTHLGAGVICSNLRLDQNEVRMTLFDGSKRNSGLRKLGAIVGDCAEVGCNAVLNPGTILGRRSLVMPTMSFRGSLAEDTVAFQEATLHTAPRVPPS